MAEGHIAAEVLGVGVVRSRLSELSQRIRDSAIAARTAGFLRLANVLDEQARLVENLAAAAELPPIWVVEKSIAQAEQALAVWHSLAVF